MTKGERAFGDLLTTGLAVAAVGGLVGAFMVGLPLLFGVAVNLIHMIGVPVIATRKNPNLSLWALWALTAGFGSIIIAVGILRDSINRKGWKATMPAFIWPERSSDTPSFWARIGRVFHWLFVVAAALSLIAGAVAVMINQQSIQQAHTDLAKWDQQHPLPGHPGFVLNQAPNEWGGDDYRPSIPPESYVGLWIGVGAALIFLLIGRGFRYVLANE